MPRGSELLYYPETRSHDHAKEVVNKLREAGYDIRQTL